MKKKSIICSVREVLRMFSLILGTVLLLAGCRTKPPADAEEKSGYAIYYTNSEHSRLLETRYELQEETFEGMLTELLDQLQHPENTELTSVFPEGVYINEYTIGVDSLMLDFSGSYIGMNNVEEILLRAGVVKTLVQLPGIYTISITVDGQPLIEPSSGQPVGPMRGETFVDSREDSINSYQSMELKLYFPSYDGSRLVAEERSAFFSSNLIMERVIVEQLLKGPQTPGLLSIASPSTLINSVKVSDRICVIDLDSTFNRTFTTQIKPEMVLYAIVDSVMEQCDIDGVTFRINGDADVRFQNEISLDQVFTQDRSLIRETETAGKEDAGR